MTNSKKTDLLYLIDGSGYIFRAFYALPPLTRKSDGMPVGAVSGFCNMLYKFLEDAKSKNGHEKPTHIAVIFDSARKNFRNSIYPEYKANRTETPEDLIPQFSFIREAVKAFNLPSIEMENYEADDLIATYKKEALKNISLNVNKGEIFGLLGPNGAGKSTFINILAGTVIKSSGSVKVWNFDLDKNPREVRSSIGIVPQETNLDPFFSPRKLLEIQAGMYGIKESERITDKILEITMLKDKADSYARSLSGGMKRRLLVAKALVHRPPILILDEPTAGVDVDLRQQLLENIQQLNKQGVTIILTTHYLQEAQQLCDRIAIINNGELIALDKTENLLNNILTKKIIFKLKVPKNIGEKLKSGLTINYPKPDLISVTYNKNENKIEEIISEVKEKNIEILDILTEDADLEDVFLKLTKKKCLITKFKIKNFFY